MLIYILIALAAISFIMLIGFLIKGIHSESLHPIGGGIIMILPTLFFAVSSFLGMSKMGTARTAREECIETKSNINLTAANLLKAASKVSSFVDKRTDIYKEIMTAIAEARTKDYSASSIDRVYNIVMENYPTDMNIGELWQTYVTEVQDAYLSILDAQKEYNRKVKEYKSLFTPITKLLLAGTSSAEDETIEYYTLDYRINYDTSDWQK